MRATLPAPERLDSAQVDGTARLQSVEPGDEPFIELVLKGLARRTGGPPVVCNTSFNRRGEPILNTASEALALLCEEPELDFVVVENALFEKCAACPGACADGAVNWDL